MKVTSHEPENNSVYTIGYIGYTQGHGERFPHLNLVEECVFFETEEQAENYNKVNGTNYLIIKLKRFDSSKTTSRVNPYEFYSQFLPTRSSPTEKQIKIEEETKGMGMSEALQYEIDREFIVAVEKLVKHYNPKLKVNEQRN